MQNLQLQAGTQQKTEVHLSQLHKQDALLAHGMPQQHTLLPFCCNAAHENAKCLEVARFLNLQNFQLQAGTQQKREMHLS